MSPISLFEEEEEQLPENDHVFLLYSNESCVTGRNLARYLGVPHGKNCSDHIDYLIRWGSSTGVKYIPDEEPINSKRSVYLNTDKLDSLRRLRDEEVSVPTFSTNLNDLEYPILGRDINHTRGQDINLILQERDDYLTSNDFYVEYVPTEFEYRMHVMDGEVFCVHEKRLRNDEENHPYIRNYETGWVFCDPRETPPPSSVAVEAVDALGLDFGAVDVIRGEDGDHYVLEVNTAPSCDEPNLERWGDVLAQRVALRDYPGMEHPDIEFENHEDEEENDE